MVALGIADDEPDILKLFKIVLWKNGYPIAYMAQNGEEAVAMQRKTPADIVFMDYNMPYMDGIEATKKILGEFPGTKVYLMTCGEDIAGLIKSPCDVTIIKKPFPFKAIINILGQLYRQ